jgi:hypothetical protein
VDDVGKISTNVKALEEALQELDNKAHKTEVTIIQEKNKIYESKKTDDQCQRTAIGVYRFERVSKFSLFRFNNK